MGATLIGITGVWGIANDQTGIIISDYSLDYSNNEKPCLNRSGEPTGFAFWGEKVDIKVSGLVPVTAPFSGKIGAVLVLGNAMPAHLQSTITGGTTILKQVSRSANNEDFEKIDLSATHHPFVTTGA